MAAGLLTVCEGIANGQLTVGDFVLFVTMARQCYAPLNFLGQYYKQLVQQMTDLENLIELLARQSRVQDEALAKELEVTDGHIEWSRVMFSYQSQLVLRGVSCEVPGGGSIAFVGPTGSGKSTVLRLLYRFYDPSSGMIRIDGQNIREVTQASLRRAMAMVPQDTPMFNNTILYNIRYGNTRATDDQVIWAADSAAIKQVIDARFPEGFDTLVGERGLRLSGGEKQRVAFARAILKNAPILVLDEATSALDTITESKIQDALNSLRARRTKVVVAHRLATVRDCDVIVVLKEGDVVEMGTHEELLGQQGVYAEMWSKQAEDLNAE